MVWQRGSSFASLIVYRLRYREEAIPYVFLGLLGDLDQLGHQSLLEWLRLLQVVFFILVIAELLLVPQLNVREVVEDLFLLRLNAIVLRRVRQVEELEEPEVLQGVQLVLEEGFVEIVIVVRSVLNVFRDEKGCITILIKSDAALVAAEEFNDCLEKVGTDVTDCLCGKIAGDVGFLTRSSLITRVHHIRATLIDLRARLDFFAICRVEAVDLLLVLPDALLDQVAELVAHGLWQLLVKALLVRS